MALTIGQEAAVSYPAVLATMRKAENQWVSNGFLRELERQGGVKRKSFGPTIEAPLDYQQNPGTEFLITELTQTSLVKTEVVTSASYTPAELSVPVTWSKRDEVINPAEKQKVALVKQLLENGINSHDDKIENVLFATAANNGMNTLYTYITIDGLTSTGGIDPSTNTWWKNQHNIYVDDTDIESAMTTTWNQCAKSSGDSHAPTLIVSDSAQQALFEGTQQALQRYVDEQELKAGFKILGFKTARYVYSQYGNTTRAYMFNPKSVYLSVSKEYFRDKGETQELQNANGFNFKIYSSLQLVTTNRSRAGVFYTS